MVEEVKVQVKEKTYSASISVVWVELESACFSRFHVLTQPLVGYR